MRIVIPTVITAAHLAIKNLTTGSASEFAATENEGVLQHASCFKVMEEGRNGLVHGIRVATMPFLKASMLIPEIAIA